MQVLAIAGSLRAASINAAFCRAAVRLAAPGMSVSVHRSLGALPLFNPDLEADPPREVRELRAAVARADALLLASPEYAHGISGVMKNALDWLVSDEAFVGKPVALINTSPRARHAHAALLEVLRTMSATLVMPASISLPLLGSCTSEAQMLATPAIREQIRAALICLQALVGSGAAAGASFPVEPR